MLKDVLSPIKGGFAKQKGNEPQKAQKGFLFCAFYGPLLCHFWTFPISWAKRVNCFGGPL